MGHQTGLARGGDGWRGSLGSQVGFWRLGVSRAMITVRELAGGDGRPIPARESGSRERPHSGEEAHRLNSLLNKGAS